MNTALLVLITLWLGINTALALLLIGATYLDEWRIRRDVRRVWQQVEELTS